MTHFTIAVSEFAFGNLFANLRRNFTYSRTEPVVDFDSYRVGCNIAARLEGGDIFLTDDGWVEIENLDLVFDALVLDLWFRLPEWCVGGFCLVPDPWRGCLVRSPQVCFGGDWVNIPIDLSHLVCEVNRIRARLDPVYFVDPDRDPDWTDLEAEDNGMPNRWQIYLGVGTVSVDPLDVPASTREATVSAVHDIIFNMLSWLPDWLQALIWAEISPPLDVLRQALNFVDEFEDFVQQDLLQQDLNVFEPIGTALSRHFAGIYPLLEIEDPYPILPPDETHIPVKIPLRNLSATVNTDEMVILADIE